MGKIQRAPTESVAAYDYYLRGTTLVHRFRLEGNKKEHLENAIMMYEKAVAIDPTLLLGYAKMVKAHMWMYWPDLGGFDRSEARLVMAKNALDKARAIDPDRPETHLAAGWYYYYGYRDYEAAHKELALAIEKQPNNSEILHAIGCVERRQGRWEASVNNFRKAAELDPLNYISNADVARTYLVMRDWVEAERFTNRCLLLSPANYRAHDYKIDIIISSTGNIEEALIALDESRSILGSDAFLGWEIGLSLWGRNYESAVSPSRKEVAYAIYTLF